MNQISTILVIDDEPIARRSVEAILAPESYKLVFAEDGLSGIKLADELMPDAILLDVMMPGMDGFTVCQKLRSNPQLAEAPILMITALDDPASRLHGLECGADDFISKPFDKSELRARLRTITRLDRYRKILAERTRFQWVLENAQDGFVVLDAHQQMQYANQKARQFLYLTEDEPIFGLDFLDIVKTNYQLEPTSEWDNWPEAALAFRYIISHPGGENVTCFIQVRNLPHGPKQEHLLQLIDVTAQVTSQRDLRSFQNTLAHKLRTPLGLVISSLEIIYRDYAKFSEEEIKDLLRTAFEGSRRLRVAMDGIFKFFYAPSLVMPGEGFPVHILPRLVEALQNEIGMPEVDVFITSDLMETRLGLAYASMEVIIKELLENAYKHHPLHNPKVKIEASPGSKNDVILRIQDDGVHLTPQQIMWAWMPYMQAEKFFTGETPGMGVGLPVIATILWSLGGQAHIFNRTDSPGIIIELVIPIWYDSMSEENLLWNRLQF